MKINEVKLVESNTETKMGGTGFSIRVNNKYELLIEETTPLGFKAVNTIEVPVELSHELHNYLNGFAKKCVSEIRKSSSETLEKVTYVVSKNAIENIERLSLADSFNNQTT